MGLGCVLLHFKEAGQAQRVGWGGGILGHTWVGLGRHLGQTEIGRATNKVPEITGGHNQGNKSRGLRMFAIIKHSHLANGSNLAKCINNLQNIENF